MDGPIIVQVPADFGLGYVIACRDYPWSSKEYEVPVEYYEYNGYGPFDTYDDAVQWLQNNLWEDHKGA